jgi:dihydropteroate synthase
MMFWSLRHDLKLPLDRPVVMGILNLTPDSFSDGGELSGQGAALARARQMVAHGADLLDVGGESTRPGAAEVGVQEEIDRVAPVIDAIRRELDVPVSVDTRRAMVAEAALGAGAHAVNDVSGLADQAMAGVIASSGAGAVLMHMRGTPRTMQGLTQYADLVREVSGELEESLRRARLAGITDEAVVLDPGIGFAKTGEQNLELIRRLPELTELGRPLLLGVSRKSFIGALLGGIPAAERDAGSAGACVAGLARGARIFRVHDVLTTRHALDVAWAILEGT